MSSTITELLCSSSVRVGDYWIPATGISEAMAKYSGMFVHHNQGFRNELSTIGSCTLVKYRGGFFALATKHQFRGQDFNFDRDNALLMANEPNHYVSSSGWFDLSGPNDSSDEWDLVAFDFSDSVANCVLAPAGFLTSFGSEYLRHGEAVAWFATYGFCFQDEESIFVDDADEGSVLQHIRRVKRELICKYRGDSFEDCLFHLTAKHQSDVNLNGLSGAPVFAICGDKNNICAKLAGIVIRGGGGNIHCLKHTVIRRLLDRRPKC